MQQLLPRPIGEFELRVRFGPSRVRQRERVVDLERTFERLARLKVGAFADGARSAVVPDDGLGWRFVSAAAKEGESEPRRQHRGNEGCGDERRSSKRSRVDGQLLRTRGVRARDQQRSADFPLELAQIGFKKLRGLVAPGRIFGHRARNDPVEARWNRRVEF